MGTLSKFLKMDSAELEKEIQRNQKKIASAKETILLLKKLKIAAGSNPVDNKKRFVSSAEAWSDGSPRSQP